MDIEASIVAILNANAPFMALCRGGIHPLLMPQPPTMPAITYQRISETADYTLAGVGTFGEIRLQIDCWALSYADVSKMADAVASALDHLTGTTLGITFYNAIRDNSQDFFEAPNLYRRSVDYKLQYAV